jgi:hypothetical protein
MSTPLLYTGYSKSTATVCKNFILLLRRGRGRGEEGGGGGEEEEDPGRLTL